MKRCLLLLPALLLMVAADPAVERAARKEKVKLVGVWLWVPDLPPSELLGIGMTVHEITPQKIAITHVDFRDPKAAPRHLDDETYTLDPTKSPKTIDLTSSVGPLKGKIRQGIYQLDGNQLTIAYPTADAGPRPQKLAKSKDTALFVLRRSPHKSLKAFLDDWEKRSQKIAEEMTQNSLPRSRTAKPIDAKANVLRIDVIKGEKPAYKAAGLDTAMSLRDLQTYLKSKHEEIAKGKTPAVAVAFSPDARTDVLAVQLGMEAARAAGFADVFLQVLQASGAPGRLELLFHDWHKPIEDVIIRADVAREDDTTVTLTIKSGGNATRVENAESFEKQLAEQRGKADTLDKDNVRIQPDGAQSVGSLVWVMDSCLAAGFKRVTLSPILGLDPTESAKKPAPSAHDQAKAEKEIKKIYEASYARPANLAPKLREAADICDEPAAKFVFLREAADAAARNGQLVPSLDLFDELAREFAVDTWPLKLEKFKKAPMDQATADAALREASNADLAKRRDYAARFIRIAELSAKQTKDSDLVQYVEERRELLKLPKLDNTNPFAPMRSAEDNQPSAALVERMTATPVSVLSLVLWYGVPVVLVGVLLTAGMIWWMRRERAVRSRLSQARGRQFELPSEEPPPGG